VRIAALATLAALVGASAPACAELPGTFAVPAPGALRLLEEAGLPREPLHRALRAFACGRARGYFAAPILTLVDYSLPSSERRLWVLDLESGDVRFHDLVSHGRGSGTGRATAFSNEPGSQQSSLGLFRTGETYVGRHGYSLRLDGLERGVNDRARERAVVIHGAGYASAEFSARHGRLGRSLGCPALDPAVHREVIDAIRGGTALFAYYPDADWLASSRFQACEELEREGLFATP